MMHQAKFSSDSIQVIGEILMREAELTTEENNSAQTQPFDQPK